MSMVNEKRKHALETNKVRRVEKFSSRIIIYDSLENKETIMSRAGVEPAPYDLQSYALPSSPRDAKATLITLPSKNAASVPRVAFPK